MAEEPAPEGTRPVSDDVRRTRSRLAEAAIAARRMAERLRLARVIIAAVAQVVIAFVAWRIWVWSARRRRR